TFSTAEVSLTTSIGPPGSAIVIAMPATCGARTSVAHSSSVKSALPVMAGTVALALGHPGLRLLELGGREHPRLPRDHPGEQLGRSRHPVDVGDDGRAHPLLVVADAEIEAELAVGPERPRLDVVEVL